MTSRFSREYGAKLAKAQEDKRRVAVLQETENFVSVPRTKFGNVKTGGYSSKREAYRAAELALLQKHGKIRNLREQVPFLLIPAQYIDGKLVEKGCSYISDFVYEEPSYHTLPNGKTMACDTWRTVVEDAKGFPNDRWPIKRKLMLFVHGIRVTEV